MNRTNEKNSTVYTTLITSRQQDIITKKYKLDAKGNLCKAASAQTVTGEYDVCSIEGPEEFAELLSNLKSNNALIYGIPANNTTSGAIDSSNKDFIWPTGGGVLMLDFDFNIFPTVEGHDDLIDKISSVIPSISELNYVYSESSSSHIYHGDRDLTGLRGQRLYIFIKDATDIERAGKVIFDRLWLLGTGYYFISRSGSLLERSIIDQSVWQPSRIDFAGGVECIEPLRQLRNSPIVNCGDNLDTKTVLVDLTPHELVRLSERKKDAASVVAIEQEHMRKKYIDARVKELSRKNPSADTQDIRTSIDSALNHVLMGDYLVMMADGSEVKVRDIISNPGVYDKAITKDPLEPEYDSYKNVGRIYFNATSVVINSMAHGGRAFSLSSKTRMIEDVKGKELETAKAILAYMEEDLICFTMGGQLYRITDGKAARLDIDRLRNLIDTHYQLYITKQSKDGDVKLVVACRDLILKSIMAEDVAINPIDGVITAPVINHKGDITKPGYNKCSHLYYYPGKSNIQAPDEVSKEVAQEAFNTLMKPFAEFTCSEELDKTALQCAVLTTIMRPYFTKCPAIILDAPVYGTGKTFLAQCLGALGTGRNVSAISGIESENEMKNLIITKIMEDARVILLDNIMGKFNSVSLSSYLTSDEYEGRVSGSNIKFSSRTKMLILLTGNNMRLGGDMARRVIRITLDSKVEDLSTRVFSGNPLNYILGNRDELVQAGLAVIKGFIQSSLLKPGSMTSFESWDEMIRQPVLWLTGKDILDKYKQEQEDNSDKDDLRRFVTGGRLLMGGGEFVAKDFQRRIERVLALEPRRSNRKLIEAAKDVYDYLISIGCLRHGVLSTASIGRVLKNRINRRVDGMWISSEKGRCNLTRFKFNRA